MEILTETQTEVKDIIESELMEWADHLEEDGVSTWGDTVAIDIIEKLFEKFIITKK